MIPTGNDPCCSAQLAVHDRQTTIGDALPGIFAKLTDWLPSSVTKPALLPSGGAVEVLAEDGRHARAFARRGFIGDGAGIPPARSTTSPTARW